MCRTCSMFKFFNKKYFLVLSICLSVIVIVYLTTIYSYKEHTYLKMERKSGNYIINNSGCRIQKVDPFDPTVKKFYKNLGDMDCPGKPPVVSVINGNITLNRTALKMHYGLNDSDQVICTFEEIIRDTKSKKPDDDYFFGKKTKLQFGKPLEKEFLYVECKLRKATFYKDFIFVPILKQNTEKRCVKISSVLENITSGLNIIIVGLDSVSRLNFKRHFKRTSVVLKSLKAFELFGYNKVGDNTFPNLYPFLTGKKIDKKVKQDEYWDDVDFIWKTYSSLGYRTFLQEDFTPYSLFNYKLLGFRLPPTDYYFRHAAVALDESKLKSHSRENCIGSKLEIDRYLDYIKDFTKFMMDRRYFIFSWSASLTHNKLNYARYADKPMSQFMLDLQKQGTLNKSLLIFMSDHGIRFGDIRNTHIGSMEENLPFMFLIFPPWFLEKFPEAHKNLKINQGRLMTTFDVHATLTDLATFPVKSISKTNHGLSLLNEIPENRTCKDASIPERWCSCHVYESFSAEDELSVVLGSFVIKQLNNWTSEYAPGKCESLRLFKVLDVQRVSKGKNQEANFTEFIIMIEAQPGGGFFESTVKVDKERRRFEVLGDISRLNWYREQAWCIQKFWIEKFCHCI